MAGLPFDCGISYRCALATVLARLGLAWLGLAYAVAQLLFGSDSASLNWLNFGCDLIGKRLDVSSVVV